MAAATKTPLQKAEYHIGKQIDEVNKNDSLDLDLKTQLVDWLNGLLRSMQTVEQVIVPSCAPPAESTHGKLISLGKSQRSIANVLIAPPKAKPPTPPTGDGAAGGDTNEGDTGAAGSEAPVGAAAGAAVI